MNDQYREMLAAHPSIPAEKLLSYLEGRLGDQERQEVEMAMLESDFLSDAAEGLEQIKDPERIRSMVSDLNQHLQINTAKIRAKNRKHPAANGWWLALAALLMLLLLIIAGYSVIRLLLS